MPNYEAFPFNIGDVVQMDDENWGVVTDVDYSEDALYNVCVRFDDGPEDWVPLQDLKIRTKL